jgi:hypothetical protein
MENPMLQNDQPLYLPEGSIRAIIALGVVGAFLFQAVDLEIVALVLGFYFGQKVSA